MADYLCVSGLRYVVPYSFEFVANVKHRWEGKSAVDVFAAEFLGRPRSYYEAAESMGRCVPLTEFLNFRLWWLVAAHQSPTSLMLSKPCQASRAGAERRCRTSGGLAHVCGRPGCARAPSARAASP